MGCAVTAAAFDRERRLARADGTEFLREVGQVFYDYVDDFGVTLDPAAAGDHAGG